jgi:osmotically-inducible protein OsmY
MNKKMRMILSAMSGLALCTALGVSAGAQVVDKAKQAGDTTVDATKKAAEKTADATVSGAQKAKNTVAPKSDEEIQKCITDDLAASSKLKTLGLSVTVSNGEATLTGEGKSSGNKNAAAKIAKKCGAKKVTNNITIPSPPATKPAAEKPTEPAKKP